ncbi:MAG: hypothetical protein CME38_01490 [Haliea sp.]|nr:hypothetical protein [Haliea sp.]
MTNRMPWLTEEEVRHLTRRKQGAAQARVLQKARIPYVLVDRRPVVKRDDVDHSKPKERVKLRLE